MTKKEFEELLYFNLNTVITNKKYTKKEVGEITDIFLETIFEGANTDPKGKLKFHKCFKIEKVIQKERKGRNPRTGKAVLTPEKEKYKFSSLRPIK